MKKYIIERDKIVKCQRCKGSGNEPLDKFAGVFSFGFITFFELIDPHSCTMCNGKTFLTLKEKYAKIQYR